MVTSSSCGEGRSVATSHAICSASSEIKYIPAVTDIVHDVSDSAKALIRAPFLPPRTSPRRSQYILDRSLTKLTGIFRAYRHSYKLLHTRYYRVCGGWPSLANVFYHCHSLSLTPCPRQAQYLTQYIGRGDIKPEVGNISFRVPVELEGHVRHRRRPSPAHSVKRLMGLKLAKYSLAYISHDIGFFRRYYSALTYVREKPAVGA